jgi:hypothetical protein
MDEVEALSKTIEMGRPRWGAILPTFWWHLEDNEWHVTFDSEVTFRFRQSDGQFVDDANGLDAVTAFRIARNHALREEVRWAPAFSISRKTGEWQVGARQSQLGGQISIVVGDDGSIKSMSVNPK